MLDEFKTRFPHLHQQALGGLILVPSALVNFEQDKAMSKFQELTSLYRVDLPSPGTTTAESHCWIVKWRQHQGKYGPTSFPTTPAMALQQAGMQVDVSKHQGPSPQSLCSTTDLRDIFIRGARGALPPP